MKIIAISDLHGYLPKNIEPCELLLIAGDISPIENHAYQYQKQWMIEKFIPWAQKVPTKCIVLVPGNHDKYLYAIKDNKQHKLFRNIDNLELLINNELIYTDYDGNEISIFGIPYCTRFGNWDFMEEEETLEKMFSTIEDKYDILVCHDAPYGVSDTVEFNKFKHIGSKALLTLASRLTKCKYLIHGHLHSSNHNIEKLNDINVVNVSLLNERYEVGYEPYTFNI